MRHIRAHRGRRKHPENASRITASFPFPASVGTFRNRIDVGLETARFQILETKKRFGKKAITDVSQSPMEIKTFLD
jgi:hypothetical protein|tara:strand:+ start:838 stop:1065 length:228 start_codon:yes stop_codon:yes gene_type:complete